MITFLCISWTVALGASIIVHLRYAHANYPKSWRWELLLLGSTFVWGCIAGAAALMRDFSGYAFLFGTLSFGITAAVLYRMLFVKNMRRIIPKRPLPIDKDRK